jgi:hypothetical protein
MALVAGVVLGIVADRVYLNSANNEPDARLIGDWAGEDGDISFHADGTYEAASVFTTTANGSIIKSKQEPYSAQYRWVDQGTIEIYVPLFAEWLRQKPMFENDQLTLMGSEGAVARYTRQPTPEHPHAK